MNRSLVIATRKSPLALAQTELVRKHLTGCLPDTEIRVLPMSTVGDQRQRWSLEEGQGKGLFTTELECAVLEGTADLAVHSTKDLPTEMREGLAFAGFLPREEPNDVCVLRDGKTDPELLATSSPRRRAQASRLFPSAQWKVIRGNVSTRLRKIAEGEADGTFLALAGLRRLGIESYPGLLFRRLSTREMVPAVGQGAIGVQCRTAEAEALAGFFDTATRTAVTVERMFLEELGGGCDAGFAAHFANGILEIFHEQTGYVRDTFEAGNDEEIRQGLRSRLKELGIL